MMMLPDYPDRVVSEHRIRVEKFAVVCTMLLTAAGGWWLFANLGNNSEPIIKFGPILILFLSAFWLSELIDFTPKSKSIVASYCNILWSCILSFIGLHYSDKSNFLPLLILFLIVIILWMISNSILSYSLASRRLRGITSIAGLAISLAILSSTSDLFPWLFVILANSFTMMPDLLSKDPDFLERKDFGKELDKAELEILELKSLGHNVQQATSILKIAREEGFDNPSEGKRLIDDAIIDANKIIALSKDLEEIRNDSLMAIEKSELVTKVPKKPREKLELGDKEFQYGSFRDAEMLYREAKEIAIIIEKYWQEASDIISVSEGMIGDYSGHQIKDISGILNSAKDALSKEDPKEAIQLAESIKYHITEIGSIEEIAKKTIKDAEDAVSVLSSNISINTKERIAEAKEALKSGDSALAKGLANSVIREINSTSEAMNKVQKALRQRKTLESKMPSGKSNSEWMSKLESIIQSSNKGEWIMASKELDYLTSALRDFEEEIKEANELLSFIEEEWISIRKKLNSAGINAQDSSRISIEKNISDITQLIKEGEVQDSLSLLSETDLFIEEIRRRI
ncbi:MAG: hypothetical protein CMB47_01595 [Euryarchaeota archaeon]|nr:hypothetical protein [Euryarchaeota archaeon]